MPIYFSKRRNPLNHRKKAIYHKRLGFQMENNGVCAPLPPVNREQLFNRTSEQQSHCHTVTSALSFIHKSDACPLYNTAPTFYIIYSHINAYIYFGVFAISALSRSTSREATIICDISNYLYHCRDRSICTLYSGMAFCTCTLWTRFFFFFLLFEMPQC